MDIRGARTYLPLLFSLLAGELLFSSVLAAQAPEPYLCIGYNPSRADWGLVRLRNHDEVEANCDPGYAYISVEFPGGTPRPGRKIPPVGRCCRLPDGVLTAEQSYAVEDCPQGTVATGFRAESPLQGCDRDWRDCVKQAEKRDYSLRCTKVDEKRFQLSEAHPAYVLGFNLGFSLEEGGSQPFTTTSRVPLGIRYGATRNNLYEFDCGGYIGFPWGSILVGKHSKTEFSYREIQYRGAPGDPPAGTPLKVIPDCDSVSDPLDPNARCLKAGETVAHPLLSEIPEKPSGPPRISKVLLRHEARILQLLWGTSVGLRIQASSRHPGLDPVVVLDPKRWDVSNGEKTRDTLMANLIGPLGEQEFFLKALRDKGLPRGAADFDTSKSFRGARDGILQALRPLGRESSSEEIQSILATIAELMKGSINSLIKEGELGDFKAEDILPIEPDELRALQEFGIVGHEMDAAGIDKRSERILSAAKRAPQ